MKKASFILSIVACLLITACNNTSYTITGKVDTAIDSTMIYLQDAATEAFIDSTMILNGSFTFNGETQETFIVNIMNSQNHNSIIIEPGYDYEIDLAKGNITLGSPLNDDLITVNDSIININTRIQSFIKEIEPRMTSGEISREEATEMYNKIQIVGLENLINTLETLMPNHTNDATGALLLKYYFMVASDFNRINEYISTMSDYVKTHPILAQEMKEMEILSHTMEGQMFADFTVEQPDGKEVSLSDYVGKGKYVLVDFWASWCNPCRKAMPAIKALYNEYHPKGLEVLGVLVWDEVEASLKAIEEEKAPWPQILNTQKVASDIYAISGIPHLIFFGPDGTILKRGMPDNEFFTFVKETIDNNK